MTPKFEKVSGKSEVKPNIPALKYDRAVEKDANQRIEVNLSKLMINSKSYNVAFFFVKEMPFVGGSPDAIIMCNCCGLTCLEVKSPFFYSTHITIRFAGATSILVKEENSIPNVKLN